MTLDTKPLPSLEELQHYFRYNPTTGRLTWRHSKGKQHRRGGLVGSKANGYIVLKFQGNRYYAHRIAWKLHTEDDVDNVCVFHKDGCRHNNRISNLQLAFPAQSS